MKKTKLNQKERAIEKALVKGEYKPVNKGEFQAIAEAIQRRKKDAVLNIRINSDDLKNLKEKARNLDVPYQSFISEILHYYAAQ